MALTDKQRGVLGGMAVAGAVTIAVFAAAIWLAPPSLVPTTDISGRLALALRWDLLVIVWLLASIGNLARHRFFTPADIDGSGLTAGTDAAHVKQAILQNTLEQTVLALAVHLVAAVLLPAGWLAVIPAAAVLFAIGRALFWRGYAGGAPARAAGFALTFYPTALLFAVTVAGLFVAG